MSKDFEIGGFIKKSHKEGDTTVIDEFDLREISAIPDTAYNFISKGKMTTIPMVNAETGAPVRATYFDGGLTVEEKVIMSHLVDAWNHFAISENISDNLKDEFADGLHKCQMVLGQLVLSRMFPDYWNDK